VETTATIELDGQYRLLREDAGLLDRSGRGKLIVRGPEAAEYLQGQVTNDVEALTPREGCYAALLDRKGHMQADMRVLSLDSGELWIDTEPQTLERLRGHLALYKVGREVEVEDVSERWAIFSLLGPASGRIAGGESVEGGGDLTVPGAEHSHRPLVRDGVEALVVATDHGLDLLAPTEQGEALRELLLAAGAGVVSEPAAEILRVESGRPRFGFEMSERTIPAEAGIDERAVSFTKGCYIGQETVARLHYKGKPNRHLRGLRLESPAGAGDPVRLDERELGQVGTAVVSPALGPIALAIVRREASPGDRVAVGDENAAEVVDLPFAAPGGDRE
jgi:tRNA-modifying protein YgfZ